MAGISTTRSAAVVLPGIVVGCSLLGSASSNGSTSASSKGDPAAYSACMRKHGVKNFPNPDSKGRIKIVSGYNARTGETTGVDTNSPQFKAAQKACRGLWPYGNKQSAPSKTTRP